MSTTGSAPDAASTTGTGVRGVAARYPLALVVAGTVLYSTGPVFVASASVSGPVFSFWRLWAGVLAFGLATVVHVRVTGRRPTREGWSWAAKAGVAFGVHQLLFMTAIRHSTVVDVTLLGTLAPVVVAVMAVPLFGERPGPTFRLWTAVAIVGAALVVVAGTSGPSGDSFGITLAVLNVGAFSVFFVLSKAGREHIDVVPFLFGVMTVAALFVAAFVTVTGQPVGEITTPDLARAAVVALVPGALGHFVMTWPLRWVPANIPPVIKLDMPLISGLLAWAVLGQTVTPLHVVGGLVTVGGVAGALLSPGGRRLLASEEPDPV